jgi:hypothetical protein
MHPASKAHLLGLCQMMEDLTKSFRTAILIASQSKESETGRTVHNDNQTLQEYLSDEEDERLGAIYDEAIKAHLEVK